MKTHNETAVKEPSFSESIAKLIAKDQELVTCKKCGVEYLGYPGFPTCDACLAVENEERQRLSYQRLIDEERQRDRDARRRDFEAGWPERHVQSLARMGGAGLAKAESLFPLVESGAMIILFGDRGRGKTQIGTWMANKRLQAGGWAGSYLKAFDLFQQIKASWTKEAGFTEKDVCDGYKEACFLVIDEVHERSESDWENRSLRNILDHRYDDCLPTVVIGNWSNLEEVRNGVGASIFDRITEAGGAVHCNWSSYRSA